MNALKKEESLLKYKNLFILFLAALTGLRILYIAFGPFDLSPDEAHYWEWSRRLDLSYYSKGPGVAYTIALFTSLFGDTEFGVRAGSVFFSTLATMLIYLSGRDLFNSEKVGFYSAVIPNITPLFSAGSVLMTTDVLLVFFWVAAMYAFWKAVSTDGTLWWLLAGALTGLGFLGKYTMVLLLPGIFLYLTASKAKRGLLVRKGPYMAATLAVVFASPVIIWNLGHDQVTIKHVMGQAHLSEGLRVSLKDGLEFLGSQAGLLTPPVFIGLLYGLIVAGISGWREQREERLYLFFISAFVFLFFLLKSFQGKVQANWAVAAYIGAFPAAVKVFDDLYSKAGASGKRLFAAGSVLAVVVAVTATVILHYPGVLLSSRMDRLYSRPPYNRVLGWRELGRSVSEVYREMKKQGDTFIMSDTYQVTSLLAFYTEGNPVTYNVNTGSRRMNQYDLWPGMEGLEGDNALYVKEGAVGMEPRIKKAFDRCDRTVLEIYRFDVHVRDFSLFRCYNFGGLGAMPLNNRY